MYDIFSYYKMKKLLIPFLLFGIILIPANADSLDVYSNQQVYSKNQPLFVYGNSLPDETLILRLFSPDGTIIVFDQIKTDSDGSFRHLLMDWPESSTSLPYGTYTVEVISQKQGNASQKIDIKFTSSSELVDIPIERVVQTLVFAPETTAINNSFRIFVQVSSDGLLIGDDPKTLLGTSHVHLPDNSIESLSDDFEILHEGLYYIDYIPKKQGTYVFHMVSFNHGTISHGSVATNVLSHDIGSMSKEIIELNSILSETKSDLNILKNEISGFGTSLDSANQQIDTSVTKIDSSVISISSSIENIESASVQLNALLFPIVGAICVILALQITILARRR